MKKEVLEIIRLQEEMREIAKKISHTVLEKFGCTITFSVGLTIVRNDFFSFNIWFMDKVDEVKASSCPAQPKSREEAVEYFDMIETKSKEINSVRDNFIDIFEEMK